MTVSFEARSGLILLDCQIWGPTADLRVQLALDTGATSTVIDSNLLKAIGCDLSSSRRVSITTGSGIESVPKINLLKIEALGIHADHFPVIAHTLPPSATVAGLLGLDFLRNHRLTLDFRKAQIVLT